MHHDRAQKPAILWDGEDGTSRTMTYRDMWLKDGVTKSDKLQRELHEKIKSDIGHIAAPKHMYFVSMLPKTQRKDSEAAAQSNCGQ